MTDSSDSSPDEAARQRFREALERKKGRAGGGGGAAAEGGAAKPHGGSGPAKSQRTFRRKSGG
ncbi:MAG: DUF5302 domain-containing protein [Actinomycetota bacterium]|nr:DUF5302 domain-containing protein [Actinomycetota bacterium]